MASRQVVSVTMQLDEYLHQASLLLHRISQGRTTNVMENYVADAPVDDLAQSAALFRGAEIAANQAAEWCEYRLTELGYAVERHIKEVDKE